MELAQLGNQILGGNQLYNVLITNHVFFNDFFNGDVCNDR
jgi:hypothetical protein